MSPCRNPSSSLRRAPPPQLVLSEKPQTLFGRMLKPLKVMYTMMTLMASVKQRSHGPLLLRSAR